MKIVASIILYNKYIKNSPAFISLRNQNCNIVIFDNSSNEEIRNKNRLYCDKKNINYFTQSKNVGLAKGYNFMINSLSYEYDFFLTSDDDTCYPNNYIAKFIEEIDDKYDVFFPQIISINGKKRVEMNYRSKFIPFLVPYSKKKTEYFILINSGTFYRSSVFKKIRYNERLFVEFIDHDFSKKLYENSFKQKKIDIQITQNFSTLLERCDKGGRIYYTYDDYFVYYGIAAPFYLFMELFWGFLKTRNLLLIKAFFKIVFMKVSKNAKC